jgi:type IV pilus assembly protein PilC
MLSSGVEIRNALKTTAKKSHSPKTRAIFININDEVNSGIDISTAMRKQGNAFPELVLDLVHVGEQTGNLPEVLKALADHYDHIYKLRRDFYSSMVWPILQAVVAILIVGLVILMLGFIDQSQAGSQEPGFDPLGFGLRGVNGALIWLLMSFGSIAAVGCIIWLISMTFAGKRYLDYFLLSLPVVGPCLTNLALARFTWGFYLTQNSGLGIIDSLDSSLNATSNGAFIGAFPKISHMIESGESLEDSLFATQLFPDEFIEMVHVGETSGTVPETLYRLSPHFEEEARRSMQTLSTVLNVTIRVLVSIFIIFLIFRIAMKYIGLINDYADNPL